MDSHAKINGTQKMKNTEYRLDKLGIKLPKAPAIATGYQPKFAPYTIAGNSIYVSGRLAKEGDDILSGRVGKEITIEKAILAAEGIALEIVAILKQASGGDLDRISRISRMFVMVRGADHFDAPHQVADGASNAFARIFGERGVHARTAISTLNLPFGCCIEIDLIAEIE